MSDNADVIQRYNHAALLHESNNDNTAAICDYIALMQESIISGNMASALYYQQQIARLTH